MRRGWHSPFNPLLPWLSNGFLTMLSEKVLRLLSNVPEIKEKQKKCLNLLLSALFKHTRILKVKSHLRWRQIFKRTSKETEVYFSGFKRSWFVTGGFRSLLCVSVFQGSLLVSVIKMNGSPVCRVWQNSRRSRAYRANFSRVHPCNTIFLY